jgi:hypothetical protein
MEEVLSRKQLFAPVCLAVTVVVAAAAAALVGRPAWAAALGAGLMLAYWALEILAWRRGAATPSFGAALGVALGGMVLRLAVVLGVLVLVAFAARDAFATSLVCFIVALTLYTGLRLFMYADLAAHDHASVS